MPAPWKELLNVIQDGKVLNRMFFDIRADSFIA